MHEIVCWHGFGYPTEFPCPDCGDTPVTVAERDERARNAEFRPAESCVARQTCIRAGECRGLTPCRVPEPDPEKRLYPQWGTEDYRIFAALFNDITHAPRHIMFSDRKALAEHLWSQGWRREVRPEDVTEK